MMWWFIYTEIMVYRENMDAVRIWSLSIQDNYLNMISVSPSKYKEIQDLTQKELPILYTIIKNGWLKSWKIGLLQYASIKAQKTK